MVCVYTCICVCVDALVYVCIHESVSIVFVFVATCLLEANATILTKKD